MSRQPSHRFQMSKVGSLLSQRNKKCVFFLSTQISNRSQFRSIYGSCAPIYGVNNIIKEAVMQQTGSKYRRVTSQAMSRLQETSQLVSNPRVETDSCYPWAGGWEKAGRHDHTAVYRRYVIYRSFNHDTNHSTECFLSTCPINSVQIISVCVYFLQIKTIGHLCVLNNVSKFNGRTDVGSILPIFKLCRRIVKKECIL